MLRLLIVLALVNVFILDDYSATATTIGIRKNVQNVLSKPTKSDHVASPSEQPNGRTHPTLITLDDFEFIRLLGEGSYGSVYLVRLRGYQKLFALKACNIYWALHVDRTRQLNFDASPWTLDGIINEFKTSEAVIDSPFMSTLRFAFRKDCWVFFVYDFAEGGSFNSQLTQKYTEIERRILERPVIYLMSKNYAKRSLIQLIKAVDDLNNLGYAHLDLHLGNLLMINGGHKSTWKKFVPISGTREGGRIQISDFGWSLPIKRLTIESMTKQNKTKWWKVLDAYKIANTISKIELTDGNQKIFNQMRLVRIALMEFDGPKLHIVNNPQQGDDNDGTTHGATCLIGLCKDNNPQQTHEEFEAMKNAQPNWGTPLGKSVIDAVKGLAYFEGVDWAMVADQRAEGLPFKPTITTPTKNLNQEIFEGKCTNRKDEDEAPLRLLTPDEWQSLSEIYYVAPEHRFPEGKFEYPHIYPVESSSNSN